MRTWLVSDRTADPHALEVLSLQERNHLQLCILYTLPRNFTALGLRSIINGRAKQRCAG